VKGVCSRRPGVPAISFDGVVLRAEVQFRSGSAATRWRFCLPAFQPSIRHTDHHRKIPYFGTNPGFSLLRSLL